MLLGIFLVLNILTMQVIRKVIIMVTIIWMAMICDRSICMAHCAIGQMGMIVIVLINR